MRIQVDYIDQNRRQSQISRDIKYVQFLKHAALAGQGYLPSLARFRRELGFLLFYTSYLSLRAFNRSRFSLPQPRYYDPTEKSQFSNLAGKAIADFLAKELSGGQATFSYESAMILQGHKLVGSRPDLYCLTTNRQFALEAKGYAHQSISAPSMQAHKTQAQAGPLPVHFACASVAYDLYGSVKVHYHDPINENVERNVRLHRDLRRLYYMDLQEDVRALLSRRHSTFEIQGRELLELDLFKGDTFRLYVARRSPRMLLDPSTILGSPETSDAFVLRQSTDEYYLDTDGIGIRL